MASSNKPQIKRFSQYRTDRLSAIPTMASAISKRISDFKTQYVKIADDAQIFFETYEAKHQKLDNFKHSIKEYDKQITIITDYQKANGKLPQIKGQKSAKRYLERLYDLKDKAQSGHTSLFTEMTQERLQRYKALDRLSDQILDLLDGRRIFSQFLGTIALSTPLPKERVRCKRNEKFKPIYITALCVALFDDARRNHEFEHAYLRENLKDIFSEQSLCYMSDEVNKLDPVAKMKYREEILKPLTKVALVHSMGSYAPEVEAIFDGDRFRNLDVSEREPMLAIMRKKSLDYLRLGIGLPRRKLDSREERRAFLEFETKKLRFMLSMVDFREGVKNELNELLRIPMTYSSFIVSTKADFDYSSIYKAYDWMLSGMKRGYYHEKFTRLFLKMVGSFPVGSGIYFLSKETNMIEKAIVSSLYPTRFDEPTVKQITRQQAQSLSHAEVIVSRDTNFYYAAAREKSELPLDMLNKRYQGKFIWNANEQWETQISALTFWKKDGTYKIN